VTHDSINVQEPREAWQYLVGQRRVRRAPTVGYDTPDFVASGANYFDEVHGFIGHPDRYDWKLVGKKEMYIPYNDNKFHAEKRDDAFVANHLNPDKVRWELHRVWDLRPLLQLASAMQYLNANSSSMKIVGRSLWRMVTTPRANCGASPRCFHLLSLRSQQ